MFHKRIGFAVSVGVATLLFGSTPADAQSLGDASSFAVVGGTSVTAASGATLTVIDGDVGVSPGTTLTGFPAFAMTVPPFTTHVNDGPAQDAQAATLALYNALVALGPGTAIGDELSSQILGPGTYSIGAANLAATGNLTLTGSGVYIFKVASSLTANVSSTVTLIGVDPCQVFWQVTSAATLNGVNFAGNVVAQSAVSLGTDATLDGRALTTSSGSVTLAGGNAVGGCVGSLLLDKQAATASFSHVGDPVSYIYTVTNTGNSPVGGPVTVFDDKVSVSCPSVTTVGNFDGFLDPGEALVCTATYLATPADVNAGSIVNHASASAGTAPGSVTPSNEATEVVPFVPPAENASITIVKKTNGTNNNAAPGLYIPVGAAVTWTYAVKNTGNVTLTNVTVTDSQGVTVICPGTTLLAGQTMTCTASGTAVAGQYSNIGTVAGRTPTGAGVTASDSDNYFGSAPAITIRKKTNGTDNNSAPGLSVTVGSILTFTYKVTNTGNVKLTVSVTDNVLGPISSAYCGYVTMLAPGASMTCTRTATAVMGLHSNVGTATGIPPAGGAVTASNIEYYTGKKDDCHGKNPHGHHEGDGCLPQHHGHYPGDKCKGKSGYHHDDDGCLENHHGHYEDDNCRGNSGYHHNGDGDDDRDGHGDWHHRD